VVAQVEALIADRLGHLDRGATHFEILGVTVDHPAAEVRKAFFALARQLHPDRLASLGIADEGRHAQRLFARINNAFAILGDSKRRAEYVSILSRGGEEAVRAEQAHAEALALAILAAEEEFHRGELALRRDQIPEAIACFLRAIELHEDEPDFHVYLAWARFCASPNKKQAFAEVRPVLDHVRSESPRTFSAPFFLGRIERILGNDREALGHLKTALKLNPSHADAAAELRMVEQRLGVGGRGST
jgi:curved DNA-binding protein CbpA